MAFVIAEPCRKNAACVDVCPVDCIHPRQDEPQFEHTERSFIDPHVCINCGLCVPVCPVLAIFVQEDLPGPWQNYSAINADHFQQHAQAYKITAKLLPH